MIEDALVFDNVIHMYNNDPANVVGHQGRLANSNMFRLSKGPHDLVSDHEINFDEYARAWSTEDVLDAAFGGGFTDFAMAQTITMYDFWKDGLSSIERVYELHRADPERVYFCAGIDPVHAGPRQAVEELTRQITEWSAVAVKFYNAHADGLTWRCDDRDIAYPLYERAGELGVTTLQFHKGFPLGTENAQDLRPDDLTRAAADFPDLNFVIMHMAFPFTEDAIWLSSRFDNIYLGASALMSFLAFAPKMFDEILGMALAWCGAEKIIYGSEAPIYGVSDPFIKLFWDWQVSEELMRDYGYPPVTARDKELILGENFARLLGLDAARLKEEARSRVAG